MTAQRVATITFDDDYYFAFIGTSENGTMLGDYRTLEAAAAAFTEYARTRYIVGDSRYQSPTHAGMCDYCGEPVTHTAQLKGGARFSHHLCANHVDGFQTQSRFTVTAIECDATEHTLFGKDVTAEEFHSVIDKHWH